MHHDKENKKVILHIVRSYDSTFRNFIQNLRNYNHIILPTAEPNPLTHPSLSVFVKYIKPKLKALKILLRERIDLVILIGYFGLPFGLLITLISKVRGIKIINWVDISEEALPKLEFKKFSFVSFVNIVNLLRFPLCILHASLNDVITCYTKYGLEVLSKFRVSREKIRVIPLGCDINFGEISVQESEIGEKYILSVARWVERKNLHTILKVFSEISKEVKDINLYVVGDFHGGRYYIPEKGIWESGEDYRDKIIYMIKNLNLKNVNFLGFVPNDSEKYKYLFKNARIFYLPSKLETFGRVYIEAMASGTPIVAMKNSAVQYVVEDGVTGFLMNTEEGQKEAILKLLREDCLWNEMRKNCLKHAEYYKWENVARIWESLINELTGNSERAVKGYNEIEVEGRDV